MNSVNRAELIKRKPRSSATFFFFAGPKCSSLSLHQLHDQSCFLLRTHRPLFGGLRLWGPKCQPGVKKKQRNLSRNVQIEAEQIVYRRGARRTSPGACNFRVGVGGWSVFRCRHSLAHFALHKKRKRLFFYIYNFLKEVVLLKCSWKTDAVSLKRGEQDIFFSRHGGGWGKELCTELTPVLFFSSVFCSPFITSESLIMLMPSQITVTVAERPHLMQSSSSLKGKRLLACSFFF